MGGVCVNGGCLPSKNLIEAAKLLHDTRNPRCPGLTAAELRLDFRALIAQKDQIVRGYREKKYESLLGGQFSLEKGRAQFVDAHTVEVNGKRLIGEKVLIATGSRPVVPPIEGLSQVPYLTSATNGYAYRAGVPSARPPADYTARVIPRRDGVAIQLEDARILWQRS